MQRRTFVTAAAAGAITATAGCLTGAIGGEETGETVLEAPEEQLADSEDLAYPAYGQRFPDFSLTDPLEGETVDTADIDGECLVCTAFYAYCLTECVTLIGALANVQHRTIDRGLEGDVRFLAITFDPERDTAEELEENAANTRVDLEAGNWHYLRPDDEARAESIVADDLGIGYDKEGSGEAYEFAHIPVTFLVNPGGYVERAYQTDAPDVEQVTEDIEAVVSGWE